LRGPANLQVRAHTRTRTHAHTHMLRERGASCASMAGGVCQASMDGGASQIRYVGPCSQIKIGASGWRMQCQGARLFFHTWCI